MNAHLVIFSLTLLASSVVQANNEIPQTSRPDTVNELTLSALEIQSSSLQRPQTSDNQIQVNKEVNEHSYQAGGQTIGSQIKRLPGVYMGGDPGENKDVRLRGMNKEFTRLEYDGIPLPDAGEKRELNVNRIPSTSIGSITLIRTPTAEEEADGIAGRMKLNLKDIPFEEELTFDAAIGSDSDFEELRKQGAFGYAKRNQNTGVRASIGYLENPINKGRQKLNEGVLSEEEQESKPLEATSIAIDAALYYGENQRNNLHLKPLYIKGEEDKTNFKTKYKNDLVDSYEEETEFKPTTTKGLGLSNEHYLSDTTVLETELGWYETTETKQKTKDTLDKNKVVNTSKQERESEDKSDGFYSVKSHITLQWGEDNTFKSGFSYRERERNKDKQKNKNGVWSSEPKDKYQLNEDYAALFAQNTFVHGAFDITPGIRLENVDLTATSKDGKADGSSYTHTLGSVVANYSLSDNTRLYAGLAQTVNRPKFDEIAPYNVNGNAKITLGNSKLKPAEALSLDIGGRYTTTSQEYGVNFVYKDIRNVIESRYAGYQTNGLDVYQIQNVGDGYLAGIELDQRIKLPTSALIELSATQSFYQSELTNADGSKTPLSEQPKILASVALDWTLPKTNTILSVGAQYIGKNTKNEGEDKEKIDSETYVDAKITQPINQNWSVYLSGSNLTEATRTKRTDNNVETEHQNAIYWLGLTGRF